MLRDAPDILITTPESLYLMLTGRAQELFEGARWCIVDEIHAVAVHQARLAPGADPGAAVAAAGRDVQRIGLSATQNPLEEVGRFMVGPQRSCRVVDTGVRKELDLKIHVPVESMVEPDDTPAPSVDPLEGGEATRRSIWPAIYPELLELIRAHKSTILFVNNRRGAERLAIRLNDLAGEELARSHHGSLAREERTVVEEMLKAGELPCLVATSSLELGIDMGAVDLVIQVESPKSVARGLQRIGRAGHSVGDVSRGRIFPKFRADLLECAVVARRMREAAIETTVVPRNALDVLAQQIVAIAAAAGDEDPVGVDDLFALVTRTHSYAELSRAQLENVLDMLDGRYPSSEFSELRPRIVWDRVAGTIRARPGARQLAVTNAGTIPDRGLYAVTLPDGRRVGELDEEMVYEARPGQTFLLGATTWRIEEIGRDRVIVTPAPGLPGAVPFWKGDTVGRPRELGEAIGAFARWAVDQTPEALEREYDLDERAARNLVEFLAEQQQATRVVPSDRAIVVERFRDEIGDWRLCVLSPFGGRVHAAWSLALSSRIREQVGLESDAIYSDDGIIIHLPDAEEPPGADLVMLEPDEIEDLVVAELGSSALFGARFRENAGPRAADPPRPSRQAHPAVAAAAEVPVAARGGQEVRRIPGDPRDLPRVPARRARRARPGRAADPAAPARADHGRGRDGHRVAVRLLAAVRLRGHLHVRGRHAQRRAAGGGAVARSRPAARAARPGGAARPDRPWRAGARGGRPAVPVGARPGGGSRRSARRAAPGRGPVVARGRRACSGRRSTPARCCESCRASAGPRGSGSTARSAGSTPPTPACTATRSGCAPPGGLPAAFLEDVPDALSRLLVRYAATHGPFTTADVRARYGIDASAALRELERDGSLVRGELRPGGSEREWCDPEVLRRLRRASLAVLRKEIEPAEQRELARFLPGWQGVDRHPASGAGVDRLREILVPLQGLAAPRRRVGARHPARAGSAPTRRRGWTSCAPAARWCGSAPGRWGETRVGWPSTSVRTWPCSAHRRTAARCRRPTRTRRCGRGWPPGPASSPTCSWTSICHPRRFRRRCGTWPGPAWPPTTPSPRCARPG